MNLLRSFAGGSCLKHTLDATYFRDNSVLLSSSGITCASTNILNIGLERKASIVSLSEVVCNGSSSANVLLLVDP